MTAIVAITVIKTINVYLFLTSRGKHFYEYSRLLCLARVIEPFPESSEAVSVSPSCVVLSCYLVFSWGLVILDEWFSPYARSSHIL